MKIIKCSLEYFINNVKEIDCISTYNNKKLFSKLIAFFTKENNIKASHIIGGLYDVQKSENRITMNALEFKTDGSHFDTLAFEKRNDKYYITSHWNYTKFYWLRLKSPATQEQIQKGYTDAINLINNHKIKYNYIALPLTLNWVYNFFNKVLSIFGAEDSYLKKYNTYIYFCTTTTIKNLLASGVLPLQLYKQDVYRTPVEVMQLDIFEVYEVIC